MSSPRQTSKKVRTALWQKDATLHAKRGLKPEEFFKKQLCEENELKSRKKLQEINFPTEYEQW